MQGIRPVWGAPRGITEGRNGFGEIGLLQIRDAQRVVAISLARIDADRLLQQIRRLCVLFVEEQAAALEEIFAALAGRATPASVVMAASM